MKLLFTLAMVFFLSISSKSYALFGNHYYSKNMNIETGISILKEQLTQIDGYSFTMGNMMLAWMEESQTKNHLCEQYDLKDQAQLHLMCVRHDLLKITDQAQENKNIDRVEATGLRTLLKKLTLKDGELTILNMNRSLSARVFNARKKKVEVPIIGSYEASAVQLRKLRVINGEVADLDPEVLALLKKAFLRKIFGLGRVTPDQYILSKYSVTQIKQMSNMIAEVQNWTDNKVSGEMILDRVGLNRKKAELQALESAFARDAQRGTMTPEVQKERTDQITNLKTELETLDTQKLISELNDQRYEAAIKLAAIPADRDQAQQEQAEALTQLINDLSDQIDELETKLESEVIVVPVDGPNLHRLAMNHLDEMINVAQRQQGGVLYGFSGNIADILMCGYLTGEVKGSVLKALLTYEDYQEYRESLLLKTGKFLWSAGKMYLMMNPYTVIPTTMISMIVGALQKKKAYEKEQSEKTHLIRH